MLKVHPASLQLPNDHLPDAPTYELEKRSLQDLPGLGGAVVAQEVAHQDRVEGGVLGVQRANPTQHAP